MTKNIYYAMHELRNNILNNLVEGIVTGDDHVDDLSRDKHVFKEYNIINNHDINFIERVAASMHNPFYEPVERT